MECVQETAGASQLNVARSDLHSIIDATFYKSSK